MSVLDRVLPNAAKGLVITDKPEDLKALLEPSCAAAIWHRHPAAGFQHWINALAPAHLPQGRMILHRDAVRAAMGELCEIADTPSCAARDQLIDDVAALSRIFADLMGVHALRLRLAAVTTNACRKFHVDAITARLICTYRGLGTQYGTAQGGRDPARVFTVPTGAPILLRGSLWPERPATGLLHRSPPIEGTDETRLVLVLDPVSNPQEAA